MMQYPQYSQYPQYPQYPVYPQYPQWQYPAYPMAPMAPVAPMKPAPPPEEGPAPKAPRGLLPDRASIIVAGVVSVITLLALFLAILAPSLGEQSGNAVPSGWSKVFDGAVHNDGSWDTASGCNFTSAGLDVSGQREGTVCAFVPSTSSDLTSQGFLLDVQLAPAGAVSGNQSPIITIGNVSGGAASAGFLSISFDQQGGYVICTPENLPLCMRGATVAWHGDGYVPNSIAVRYLPSQGQLTLYANGQAVTTIAASISGQQTLAIGADSNGEALFTHVTLYSASPAA